MGNMMPRYSNNEHVFLSRKNDLLHVHGKHDAETQQQRTCLPTTEEISTTCTWVTRCRDTATMNMSSCRGRQIYNMHMGKRMLRHNNNDHVLLPRKTDLQHAHG
jgi:hypothetical protein